MNTLYLIGGSPRSGKTTILNTFLKKKPIIAVSSDALREAARNILLDESYVSIKSLSIESDIVFHRPGENIDILHTKHFKKEITEDDLTWKAVVGLINHYDRKDIPLIVEGMTITPERVKSLNLRNLKIQAVFVGFIDNTHLDTMLTNAFTYKDWVYTWIQEHDGDDSHVREWFAEQVKENKRKSILAQEFGHKFFSITDFSREVYIEKVVDYLLE